MIKRVFDLFAALFGLLFFSPLLLPVMFLVWWQDKHSPFYVAPRIGKNEIPFRMVKLRSMVIHADKSGVDSTSENDNRITPVGQFIRRYKLDELTQLWNVLLGDMSLVGPRPNVQRETDLYTLEEKRLLSVQPGITDASSIVFSDEGEILADAIDPDLKYNQVIRPYKSMISLIYVDCPSLMTDMRLIWLTVLSLIDRDSALKGVVAYLADCGADQELLSVASRVEPLLAAAPPGASSIVKSRDKC